MAMVEALLEIAESTLREGSRSSVAKRRSVSTAYYALFHPLAKLCSDSLIGSSRRGTKDYERVYRALDHGPLRIAFDSKVLQESERISKIRVTVRHLQYERHKADYMPPIRNMYTRSKCEELIERVKTAIEDIDKLDENERRLLSTCLLFKDRRS